MVTGISSSPTGSSDQAAAAVVVAPQLPTQVTNPGTTPLDFGRTRSHSDSLTALPQSSLDPQSPMPNFRGIAKSEDHKSARSADTVFASASLGMGPKAERTFRKLRGIKEGESFFSALFSFNSTGRSTSLVKKLSGKDVPGLEHLHKGIEAVAVKLALIVGTILSPLGFVGFGAAALIRGAGVLTSAVLQLGLTLAAVVVAAPFVVVGALGYVAFKFALKPLFNHVIKPYVLPALQAFAKYVVVPGVVVASVAVTKFVLKPLLMAAVTPLTVALNAIGLSAVPKFVNKHYNRLADKFNTSRFKTGIEGYLPEKVQGAVTAMNGASSRFSNGVAVAVGGLAGLAVGLADVVLGFLPRLLTIQTNQIRSLGAMVADLNLAVSEMKAPRADTVLASNPINAAETRLEIAKTKAKADKTQLERLFLVSGLRQFAAMFLPSSYTTTGQTSAADLLEKGRDARKTRHMQELDQAVIKAQRAVTRARDSGEGVGSSLPIGPPESFLVPVSPLLDVPRPIPRRVARCIPSVAGAGNGQGGGLPPSPQTFGAKALRSREDSPWVGPARSGSDSYE